MPWEELLGERYEGDFNRHLYNLKISEGTA